MVEANDERRIDYGIVVGRAEDARIHRDERETRGTAIVFIRKCEGCKELEKVGGAMQRCNATLRRTGTLRSI
jgi:hypothetical protein